MLGGRNSDFYNFTDRIVADEKILADLALDVSPELQPNEKDLTVDNLGFVINQLPDYNDTTDTAQGIVLLVTEDGKVEASMSLQEYESQTVLISNDDRPASLPTLFFQETLLSFNYAFINHGLEVTAIRLHIFRWI